MNICNFDFKENGWGVYVPNLKLAVDSITSDYQADIIKTVRAGKDVYVPPAGNLISVEDGCHAKLEYYSEKDYKIISVGDWLELKKIILAANEIHKKFKVGDVVKNIVNGKYYTISSDPANSPMRLSYGNNNNLYTSVVERIDGVCLWKDGVFAEHVKTASGDTANFKVGDLVYLEKQYKTPNEGSNYTQHLSLNAPYKVSYVGMHRLGGNPQLCIKLEEDPKNFYQAACKFKLWDKKSVIDNPKDGLDSDSALKAAKKRADRLMSCLPGNITKEKPVKKADNSTKELTGFGSSKVVVSPPLYPNGHTNESCKNFNLGDIVYFLGECCKIVAYTERFYIITYPFGWSKYSNSEVITKGSLDFDKFYNYCTDYELSYSSSIVTKSSILDKSTTYLEHSELILPLKEESSIITTSLSEPLVLNLNKKQIKTITV